MSHCSLARKDHKLTKAEKKQQERATRGQAYIQSLYPPIICAVLPGQRPGWPASCLQSEELVSLHTTKGEGVLLGQAQTS